MSAKKWIKTPKSYVTIAMVFYLIIASIGTKNMMGIMNSTIAVAVSLAVDFIYCMVTNRKSSKDGIVITGLIISLILSVTTPKIIVAGTAAIAILSKHLFVYKKKPIFNPAAFGLLLSVFVFQSGQSWWGAFGDLSSWTILFLLIGGYIVTERVNKYPQVLSFLGIFFVLLFFMGYFNIGNAADALRPPFINATLFFGFFMLTDPPTSPAKVKNQVIFGILTAVTSIVIYGIFGGLTYLFVGLLAGNLYTYLNKRSTSKASSLKQGVSRTQRYGKMSN
ncbi:RnfABCDGE type electron transport complex subunit D [Neobacillus massiliamazoniensis]|uniref:Electron transport complex protein RnfD n=1 Tax=Neobacillus massiliamazoniensis TaxID=1499688 RepID=A0A0U1NVS1_9BACI|nr:RnfABCDGE type electron transport complex subunit D [Neobacillus massiliamazoniensis]CRK82119.1 electron transport complex protein RnfD [Neobacillus massiliamazoniensis]